MSQFLNKKMYTIDYLVSVLNYNYLEMNNSLFQRSGCCVCHQSRCSLHLQMQLVEVTQRVMVAARPYAYVSTPLITYCIFKSISQTTCYLCTNANSYLTSAISTPCSFEYLCDTFVMSRPDMLQITQGKQGDIRYLIIHLAAKTGIVQACTHKIILSLAQRVGIAGHRVSKQTVVALNCLCHFILQRVSGKFRFKH